ncbi:MAG: MaoC family dehydratase [Pseudomonadota bacterium]
MEEGAGRRDRYLADLRVGEVWEGAPFTISEAEVLAFAREFDPQPMHTDPPAAAAGRFGGLIASGWHVASRVMREFVDSAPFGNTEMLGIKVDDLIWARPVRPGDTLRVRREVLAVTPSRSRPDRGTVEVAIAAFNQHGEEVFRFRNLIQMPMHAGVRL